MNSKFPIINAFYGETIDRVPVWLMRQAGRYLPEYRKLRGKISFLTMCKTPDLAVEVTLQPVDRFGMDAAILFSDILILLEAMGLELYFDQNSGPRLECPETGLIEQVQALCIPDPEEEMGYVMDAIRQLKAPLEDKAALIGFSGAPFTLATYMIEGGSSRDFRNTKSFMYQEPVVFHQLMACLTQAVVLYLKAQIQAGVEAVQLFDTWAVVLSPDDYKEYVLPHMQKLFSELNDGGVPTIHFSVGTSTHLEAMQQTGAKVLSLDWKIDMGEARKRLGPTQPVQGNMDPLALFQPPERMERTVRNILEKATGSPGYVFNLGHGIHPKTPLENVGKLVETVHRFELPKG